MTIKSVHGADYGMSSDNSASCGYQVFEVCRERCQVLHVTVAKGRGITRGKIKDWICSPDPYVTVQVLGTPNGVKRTKADLNNCEPEWGETLDFYIDPKRDRLIEFVLYDQNRTVNEEIGREIFDYYGFAEGVDNTVVISYKNGSKIEVKLKHEENTSSSLRFGLDLCPEEKDYLHNRRPKVLAGFSSFLDQDDRPQSLSECPTVCLMTSGGGFRAMIAYSGAYKAMEDAGLIDCVTYTSALSGSSWYLATLYTHPDFTHDPHVSHKLIPEIRACVEKHWQVHLSPPWSSKYLRKIISKSVNGQPVSFTDFYGYLVGQQLLKGRMKARLSDQADKISMGQAPLPMYTCLHVKSNVSAKIFQEWYEFTPFEVGIPKYGVFLKTSDFASKFYMGQKVKSFPEVRLHFLYGIWGSAFTILFKRLIQEKGRNGQSEILKMVMHQSGFQQNSKSEEDVDFFNRCVDQEASKIVNQQDDPQFSMSDPDEEEDKISSDDSSPEVMFSCDEDVEEDNSTFGISQERRRSKSESFSPEQVQVFQEEIEQQEQMQKKKSSFGALLRQCSLPKLSLGKKTPLTRNLPSSATSPNLEECEDNSLTSSEKLLAIEEERSKWDQFLEKALTSSPLDSRAFRAGVIFSPLRGLSVMENCMYTNATEELLLDDNDFKDYREPMKTEEKKIYLVDSGLSFNLPFPLTLRPQRGIELYVTCDFSSRASDCTKPFRELLMAEKWANLHHIPFPPIREMAKQFLDEPVRECYVFKDVDNHEIPVVIFFPLINKDFRQFKSPGVLRETDEERNFADFDIFDNTNNYAIWRFVYPNLSFDRMTALMEFNVLNNLDVIQSEMAEIVRRKKSSLKKS